MISHKLPRKQEILKNFPEASVETGGVEKLCQEFEMEPFPCGTST